MTTHFISYLHRGLAAAFLISLAPGCIITVDDGNDDVGTSETESESESESSSTDATTSTDDEASTDDATTESTGTESTGTESTGTETTGTETSTDTTTDTTTDTGGVLSFEVDVYPILMSNCGCHVAGASGMLAMPNAATAYDNLVDVPSAGDPAFIRVEPGNSLDSYLVKKLTGTQTVGASMPFGGGMLPAQDIATITMWIDEGAAP